MSVDLFLFRGGGIPKSELAPAIKTLAPAVEAHRAALHLWQLETAQFRHREGWDEEGFEAVERTVYAGDHVALSAGSSKWGGLVFLAARLAAALDARVFDPQEGACLDLSDAPSLEQVAAWRERFVTEHGLRLEVSRVSNQGAWLSTHSAAPLDLVLAALSTAMGHHCERDSQRQLDWETQLPTGSGQVRLRWSDMSRWSHPSTLTLSAPAEHAAEVDDLAVELERSHSAAFDRVVAYRSPRVSDSS